MLVLFVYLAHLAVAAEGLLALQKLGIQPSVALEAINTSSGRSLATEKRMPERILSRTFDHGFAISELTFVTSSSVVMLSTLFKVNQ